MAKQTLIVADGRTVPQEDGTPWPVEGMEDPGTFYTRRRLADGDLVKAVAVKPGKEPAKEPEGK